MLNQDRIRLMTQLAAYEQGEGKEYMAMNRYYRKDYVGLQRIKTFIYSTIAFGALYLLYVLYDLEAWLDALNQIDLQNYIISVLLKYVLFVIAYQVIAGVIYTLRYQKGHKRQKVYASKLKRVEKMHEKEEKIVSRDEWND